LKFLIMSRRAKRLLSGRLWLAAAYLVVAGCGFLPGDAAILIEGTVTGSEIILTQDQCLLKLLRAPAGEVLLEVRVGAHFVEGTVLPARLEKAYVELSCAGEEGIYRSSAFDVADYKTQSLDLGRVELGSAGGM
jgi:hypothetical protein